MLSESLVFRESESCLRRCGDRVIEQGQRFWSNTSDIREECSSMAVGLFRGIREVVRGVRAVDLEGGRVQFFRMSRRERVFAAAERMKLGAIWAWHNLGLLHDLFSSAEAAVSFCAPALYGRVLLVHPGFHATRLALSALWQAKLFCHETGGRVQRTIWLYGVVQALRTVAFILLYRQTV